MEPTSLQDRISEFQQQLEPAELIVVTKGRSAADLKKVLASSAKHIAENRLQEIQQKYDEQAKEMLQKRGIQLHFIGKLQSNKLKKIIEYCDVLHSVESLSYAKKIENICSELNKVMPVFFQLNLSAEPQKSGFLVETPQQEQELQSIIEQVQKMPHLQLKGFMVMGKHGDAEATENIFKKAQQLNLDYGFSQLSMGMSQDYQIALKHGSTMLRIGSAIFSDSPNEQLMIA